MNRKVAGAVGIWTLCAGLLATPISADALSAPSEVSTTQIAGMVVVGHDSAVAKAHGFALKRDASGRIVSVPQTDQAKAIAARFQKVDGTGRVSPMNTKYGDCGTSSLFISHISGGVRIKTAYSVYTTAVSQNWNVDGTTTTVGWSEGFSGLNFSATWTATHDHKVGGASSATAAVRRGSTATLIDGTVCGSYGPTDSY